MPKIPKSKRKEIANEAKAAKLAGGLDESTLAYFRKELDIDIVEEYRGLKRIAKLPADKLMDRMALSRALNACAYSARRANLIYLKARAEREMFRIEFDRKMRELTRRATEQVDQWMQENDVKKKQITKDMVQQEIASDKELRAEYEGLVRRQEELKAIRDDCQVLAKEWADRKWTLRAQAQLLAAEREVKLAD